MAEWFRFHKEWKMGLELLSDAEAGSWLRALLCFEEGGEPELSGSARTLFEMCLPRLIGDREREEAFLLHQRAAGRKGGRPRKNPPREPSVPVRAAESRFPERCDAQISPELFSDGETPGEEALLRLFLEAEETRPVPAPGRETAGTFALFLPFAGPEEETCARTKPGTEPAGEGALPFSGPDDRDLPPSALPGMESAPAGRAAAPSRSATPKNRSGAGENNPGLFAGNKNPTLSGEEKNPGLSDPFAQNPARANNSGTPKLLRPVKLFKGTGDNILSLPQLIREFQAAY